ncbi:MAG: DeoR/GlpR transcriptional regulator, partial [Cohnella sp.]|nr:DeoR/GlpR transcriptional regulator [Cohnella sp.]
VIKAMMRNARKKIVIADSSKFDIVSFINVCPLSCIDEIVTDSKLSDETIQRYRKSKVIINHAK